MKKYSWLLLIFLLIHTFSGAYAQQQDHFVYIQSDDKMSFDVTVNGTTYTSSAIGYVIVPKLSRGEYKFTVSFPNKKFPDQEFVFNVDKVDAGFALKNYGEKGWGLYNLQTLDITMAGGKAGETVTETTQQPNNNAFGNMLSEVVDDSTLNKTVTLEKTEQQKAAEVLAQQQNAVPQVADTAMKIKEAQLNEAKNIAIQTKSLAKLNEFVSDAGRDVIFLDNGNGLNDTIRIFLPKALTEVEEKSVVTNTDTAKPIVVDNSVAIQKNMQPDTDTVKSEVVGKSGDPNNPFFNGAESTVKEKQTIDNAQGNSEVKPAPLPTPNCAESVSESDIDKLRKKIVSASGEEKMLAAVRKTIADKCITTIQVKSLSPLFPSDDSRYNFLKAVYTSVSDTENLASLDSQLIDPVYKSRYNELLR